MGPDDPIFANRPSRTAMRYHYGGGGQVMSFSSLKDPALLEFIREGGSSGISSKMALQTACVLRCVDLLSSSLAMLPIRIMNGWEEATAHPLFELLRWQPNPMQTAFEFVKLMEVRRITTGNAYAMIARGYKNKVTGLLPLDPTTVQVIDNGDWSLSYRVTRPSGGQETLQANEILHLRDISLDGMVGVGRTKLASRAIKIARAAEDAQDSIFENGMISGGTIEHPQELGDEAYNRLKASLEAQYAGTANAGRWMLLEEGMKANRQTMTGQEAQTVEARNHQIEDIARVFGIPRPLLMMDDTSWGSGIEQLAILFVRFGLNPGMVAWEQALRRSLLSPGERAGYTIDIDEQELLRGTMKDQAEFFAKALGAGGSKPWMQPNEVRQLTGFAPHEEGTGLKPVQQKEKSNGTSGQDQDPAEQ